MGNHKNKHLTRHEWAEGVQKKQLPQKELTEELPLSLIIPVYNCSQTISMTLESVRAQQYPFLEVIVVDAGSTDRTLQIVNSYAPLVGRIYTARSFNLADMVNRGISLASGKYISFLFPGSFYLSDMTYQTFAQQVIEEHFPDLIYCGSIQREIEREPRLIYLPFDINFLEQGKLPATLSSCWFRSDLFEKIGKFNTSYSIRFGFDFFCRFATQNEVRAAQINRVFVDFDYGFFSYGKILRLAVETWQILATHFGATKTFRWCLTINYFLIVKGLWRRFKKKVFEK